MEFFFVVLKDQSKHLSNMFILPFQTVINFFYRIEKTLITTKQGSLSFLAKGERSSAPVPLSFAISKTCSPFGQ
ncbi:hypothetical protein BpHYR1_004952 [Brachionus plicatilis]|uniref:Uncharacterized protein n=1 Tax=Brachionus plicatilis TaxID=10195 RepID=A0A3M7Q441_BRAPC|nr:hypothetical protein BpHYR1_004952 [Brachionus plicatilis]